MGLNLLAGPASSALQAAVAAAQATADNARQMVLNRDPKLDTASSDAAAAMSQATIYDQQSQIDRAAIHAQLDALQTRVNNIALAARPIAALVLGASTTLVMPLSKTMPNSNYTVTFAHTAVADLTNVTFTVTAKTTTTVTVTVKSVGLALALGTVIAAAW